MQMALKASMFVAVCAKVGLEALIDEATGYQIDRADDALQVKLKAYLSEEMRKWEKTFPDELWLEFARLTGWKGTVSQHPKYCGKLVLELVYQYLDPNVAQWLKENAPTHGVARTTINGLALSTASCRAHVDANRRCSHL